MRNWTKIHYGIAHMLGLPEGWGINIIMHKGGFNEVLCFQEGSRGTQTKSYYGAIKDCVKVAHMWREELWVNENNNGR